MGRGPTATYHKALNRHYQKGTLTCLKSSTLKERASPEFPLVINVEPTNDCNLNCYYCARRKSTKPVGYMTFGRAASVIDEAADHPKLVMMNFHKDGEPLLHPEIDRMIRYASDRGVAEVLHLNTNGLCLSDEMIERLLDSGLDDVTLSIDAFKRETYSSTKGHDLLPLVDRQARRFVELREKGRYRKPWIRAKIIEFQETSSEVADFHAYWETIVDEVQVTGIHNWSGAISQVQVTDETSETRYPCILLWYSLAVNWTGEVSVCSVDWDTSTCIGKITQTGVQEAWRGGMIRKARKRELEGRHDSFRVCRKCVVWAAGDDLTDYFKTRTEFL
jgi:wyosine [tRNA(Phe)-imidazoG37] synthetase (radical SAM superfamily)